VRCRVSRCGMVAGSFGKITWEIRISSILTLTPRKPGISQEPTLRRWVYFSNSWINGNKASRFPISAQGIIGLQRWTHPWYKCSTISVMLSSVRNLTFNPNLTIRFYRMLLSPIHRGGLLVTDDADATKAMEALDGSDFGGRALKVNEARQRGERQARRSWY